jgi:hypothetical protein
MPLISTVAATKKLVKTDFPNYVLMIGIMTFFAYTMN